jgi:hypothetical protein
MPRFQQVEHGEQKERLVGSSALALVRIHAQSGETA